MDFIEERKGITLPSKKREGITFNYIEQLDQAIKSSFLHTFLNWARMYTEDHILSVIDFNTLLFFK